MCRTKIISLVIVLITISIIILLASCSLKYTYETPEKNDDGWATASLQSVGLNEEKLCELIQDINQGKYKNIHSILIAKDESLVFEEYFDGYTFDYFDDQFKGEHTEFGVNTIHNLASVTKAYTSASIGIAVDQGFIPSVEQPIFTYFPDYLYLNDSDKKSNYFGTFAYNDFGLGMERRGCTFDRY